MGFMHGDYFWGNILCRSGRIVGLIDWDETRYGRLIAELAWSVWEFGKSRGGDALILDDANAFISAYKLAGGPVEPSGTLIPLIQERLRRDIAFWRRMHAEGRIVLNDDEAKVSAFQSLRQVTLSL